MKKEIIEISGMHCKSCEILLEKEVSKIQSVRKCRANHKKGILIIEYKKTLNQSEIENAIKVCDYKIGKESHLTENKYLQIIAAFLVAGLVLFLFTSLEVLQFLPDSSADVGLFVALLLGVVASLSTCMALVGGIIIGFSNSYPVQESKKHRFYHRALPHIQFHIGRILSFAILGGLLGLLGQEINFSLNFTAYLTMIIAVVMFYIALQILDFVPNITKLGFHLPSSISRKINDLEKHESPLIPGIIGALTFFLPCGFTQSMQLAAVGSQSFVSGALIMTFFALGTLPALFMIGLGSTYIRKNNFGFLRKMIGALVVFFALYSFNSGLILSGSTMTLDFWNNASSKEVIEQIIYSENGEQIVKMDVDYSFVQNVFHVKTGIPVRWEINAINVSGCTDEIIIPKFGITSGKLKPGINVIEFTPTEKGILPFSCWMGMQGGKFIVE